MFKNIKPIQLSSTLLISLLCIVIFIIDQLIPISSLFGLHSFDSSKFELFQLVTSMFMHHNFQHIFYNLLIFYTLSSIVEQYLIKKYYFTKESYFVMLIVCGILVSIPEPNFGISTMEYEGVKVDINHIGLSGLCMFICGLAMMLLPKSKLHLFGIVPIKIVYLVPVIFAIDCLGFYRNYTDRYEIVKAMTGPSNMVLVAHLTHMVGVLTGVLVYPFLRIRRCLILKQYKNESNKRN